MLFSFIFSQSWVIDSSESYIKYTGTHRLHQWEGESKDITFSLDCKNQCSLAVSVPLETLDSGNDSRDSNMLYYTESLLFPDVSFVSNDFIFSGDFDTSVDIDGILNFHGVEKNIPVKIQLSNQGDNLWGTCSFSISLNEFNVKRPSLLMMKIYDEIKIEAKFKLLSN